MGIPPDTVCSGGDCYIRLWDIATGEMRHSIPAGHGGKVCGVCLFNPVGEPAVAVSMGMDRTIKIWDVDSSSCLKVGGHVRPPLPPLV